MTAANKVVRAFWKAGFRHDNSAETLARYFEHMTAAGIASPTVACKLLEHDFAGRIGFASYELTNNGANIRRITARIAELERNATRQTNETARPDGIRVVENAEDNRLQIFFPAKPPETARRLLKSHGFRWSPSAGAWQRHLLNSAWPATNVLEAINREAAR